MEDLEKYEREAYELGAEHARNAASWVVDGNTDPAHYARILTMLDAGDPQVGYMLPTCPNLSGEYADDPTPQSLYRSIIGGTPAYSNGDDADLMDALANAYERGVSDTFEPECERILRAAVTS